MIATHFGDAVPMRHYSADRALDIPDDCHKSGAWRLTTSAVTSDLPDLIVGNLFGLISVISENFEPIGSETVEY